MPTNPLTPDLLARSVMAVPPLCRDDREHVSTEENLRLIRHLETGGVSLLLYGGNANFYHLHPSEFEATLQLLADVPSDATLVVPSVGPAFGTMMDQANRVRGMPFPVVMILPQQGVTTSSGVATGIRRFVEKAGVLALVYVKNDGYLEPEDIAALDRDGLVAGVKYATVRPDPSRDEYLRKLVGLVDPGKILSGIGEQPALVHLREFGLGGFTSGCICVAPRLSQAMRAAIRRGDWDEADRLRGLFRPLEDLRNAIHPIRVLHEAVDAAGIARTGPLLPLLSRLELGERPAVASVARDLLEHERRSANG